MRIQFEIKESLINILDQLMHSDFWATEIKEDESGKKIIKIKDLAYNLEVWGIERSGFFNDRGKCVKSFENQRV